MDCKQTASKITNSIKKYFKKNNFNKAVIGLSGGLDSSLALVLTVKALGKENVHAVLMPERGITKKENVEDAINLAEDIGISYSIIAINLFLKVFGNIKWKQNKVAVMNTKARVRANILYNYANSHKALVIGTSNKSELMLGYFTKYGDSAADIEVIGSLFKTEVIKLAKFLKLPKKIINKRPSAELYKGHTDEQELGAGYKEIDKILKQIEKGRKPKGRLAESIIKRINENEHKKHMPPMI